ncbi:DUF6221 family protein [Streptomyces sp. NPDC056982]|uniref:DUF6221 family protein n=1 Tax=Streptomyces sp. NPDC056982 TaxID=3345986 RepID=UPI0036381920
MTAQGENLLAWTTAAITRREQLAFDALSHGRAGRWIANGATVEIAPELVGPKDDAFEQTVAFNEGAPTEEQAEHIAANDPESVLRRCTADRKLLALHGGVAHHCPVFDDDGGHDAWVAFYDHETCPVIELLAEGYGFAAGQTSPSKGDQVT